MTVIDHSIQKLAEMLETLGLNVGDRLPAERKLCEMLSMSRATLREALSQLNAQGMLSKRQGSGSYLNAHPSLWSISPNLNVLGSLMSEDPDYRYDVQEARAVLESGTAWYAAKRASEEDRQMIREAYERLLHYQAQGQDELSADADAAFHLAIAEASHNVVLIQMMRNVFKLLRYNVALGRRKLYADQQRFDQLNLQHAEVLEAIERRDPEAASRAVRQHLDFVIQEVREIDEAEARRLRKNRLDI